MAEPEHIMEEAVGRVDRLCTSAHPAAAGRGILNHSLGLRAEGPTRTTEDMRHIVAAEGLCAAGIRTRAMEDDTIAAHRMRRVFVYRKARARGGMGLRRIHLY